MRTLSFTAQKGGINRQRIKGGARADVLYDLVNGYVTGSQTIVQRDGTIRDTILPSTTRGLAAFEELLHTFSHQLELYTPVGYLANVLAHPTDDEATIAKIHFAEPFMGALYVVAEWSDGNVYHYWLASSGEWAADTVYKEGDVVTPTAPNGLLYKATPNNPDAPTQTWQPLKNYVVGDKVLPTTYNGYYFEVTSTQGDVPISGAVEPTWNATEGAETTENVDGTGAPASSASEAGAPQVPPPISDRYGTGGTELSAAAAAAVGLSDSVPSWQPGTLYQPGALVKPLSAAPVINSAIPNADFESGDTAWTKGTGWTITNSGSGEDGNKPYQGAYFAKFNAAAVSDSLYHYLEMATKVPVVPGQFVSASCYESRDADEIRSKLFLRWYDQYDVLIKETEGSESDSNKSKDYRVFTVQDTTPGGATKLSVAFGCRSFFYPFGGEGTVAVDSFTWDYVNLTPAEADFTVYQATQAAAATSGSSEPVWPGAGNTVVDGGVTWLGGVTSVITWTARPIMKSGSSEPTWGTQPDSAAPDNTISWVATTGYVAEAPNSKVVALAAQKVFAADGDIVRYSATVNPLDWTSADNAGYLPTGLNTYGANPVKAMGLYRGNLVPFNSAGFQMWQVDPDPELMQLLDAVPIGSTYHKALQAVKNDLVFLTQLGYRSIGIAGGATNLKAGDLGDPIDALVQPKIQSGEYEPGSIYYPARGQYWGWFGPEVFVCTFNDEGRSWSRYVFPEAITDATLLGNDLYLRTETHKVWKVDAATLEDDVGELHVLLSASQEPGQEVEVSWSLDDGTTELDNFRLYRSLNGGSFTLLATLAGDVFEYADEGSYQTGDELVYYVEAVKGEDVAISNQASLTFDSGVGIESEAGSIFAGFQANNAILEGSYGGKVGDVDALLPDGVFTVISDYNFPLGDDPVVNYDGFYVQVQDSPAPAADLFASITINGATYNTGDCAAFGGDAVLPEDPSAPYTGTTTVTGGPVRWWWWPGRAGLGDGQYAVQLN